MTTETPQPRRRRRKLAQLAIASILALAGLGATLGAIEGASAKGGPKPKDTIDAKIEGTTLVVTGTDAPETFTLGLKTGDTKRLVVQLAGTPSASIEFNRDSFDAIRVNAGAGNDTVTLNDLQGVFTDTEQTSLYGEAGNDTLTGGNGGELLDGGDGADIILGKGGADSLSGGGDNDTLTGGDGDDTVLGDAGNDLMVWNPGDDTDINEGGTDSDTVQVNGGGADEQFTTTANGTRVRFDRLAPAPFSLDIGTAERLVLNMNGGQDSHSATGALSALIALTIDGGAGNDTVLGSNGIDLLLGGDDNDFVDGQQGNDTAFLGAGDDVFQWDPGDGSDTVEGQDGSDTLLFNGSGAAESFAFSPNLSRVLFTRNIGSIVMDLNDVETVDVNALGEADTVTLNDMTGTDLTNVHLNLALFGRSVDGAIDSVIMNGTAGADIISVAGNSAGVMVAGLAPLVAITGQEPTDSLTINTLDGADVVDAAGLAPGTIDLVVN